MIPPSSGPSCLSLIAAVTRDGGIGLANRLLVHLPEDLKHFRRITLGCPVIMGRKTWDSLPEAFRPLPGRRNLVLSRDPNVVCPGAQTHAGLPQALAALAGEPRAFIIGGAEVYRLALPLADELVLTEIDAQPLADAFFPAWDRSAYEEVSRIPGTPPSSEGTFPSYAFVTYRRRRHATLHTTEPATP